MGEALSEWLSDAGSTPARSTNCAKEDPVKAGGFLGATSFVIDYNNAA